MKDRRRPEQGETLMGLLVGLALGLLALTAGTQMLAQLLRGQRLVLQDSQLQQDLHAALDLMATELQDAQYSAMAWSSRSPTRCDDDFCDGPEDFRVSSDRLDWTVDRNHNARLDNNECIGLRLRAGALQMRTACTPETWDALTDTANLQLTRLQASTQCVPQSGWLQRQVLLEVQAHAPLAPERPLVLQRRVLLRNPLPQAMQARYCP